MRPLNVHLISLKLKEAMNARRVRGGAGSLGRHPWLLQHPLPPFVPLVPLSLPPSLTALSSRGYARCETLHQSPTYRPKKLYSQLTLTNTN